MASARTPHLGGYVSMREGHIIIEKAPPARW
jgi:hypothetical protein